MFYKDSYIFTAVRGVIVGQFGNVHCTVIFGGVDMIGFFVIVNEERHVSYHLSGVEMSAENVKGIGVLFLKRPIFENFPLRVSVMGFL